MFGVQVGSRPVTARRCCFDGLAASTRWARAVRVVILAGGLLIASFGLTAPSALAASTPTVTLGQASTYAVLSGASVGNTVNAPGAPHTTLRGDLGVKADTQPTGFPPGIVTGTTRIGSTANPGLHRPCLGLQRRRQSDGRYRIRRRSGRRDSHARPLHHRCRGLKHRSSDP